MLGPPGAAAPQRQPAGRRRDRTHRHAREDRHFRSRGSIRLPLRDRCRSEPARGSTSNKRAGPHPQLTRLVDELAHTGDADANTTGAGGTSGALLLERDIVFTRSASAPRASTTSSTGSAGPRCAKTIPTRCSAAPTTSSCCDLPADQAARAAQGERPSPCPSRRHRRRRRPSSARATCWRCELALRQHAGPADRRDNPDPYRRAPHLDHVRPLERISSCTSVEQAGPTPPPGAEQAARTGRRSARQVDHAARRDPTS